MRTLIVSDLHLGLRSGIDVLRRPEPLARLLQAIDDVDRLVLLGDVLEPLPRTTRNGMSVAEQTLRAIGRTLGPERTVVIVPGNHDGRLVRTWALARGESLGVGDEVDLTATAELSMVASWLAPAQVRCSYPGFWVADGIWATHGHYLDRHLIPETAFGLRRSAITRWFGRRMAPDDVRGAAIDYEWARRRRATQRRRGASRRGFGGRLRDRPLATLLESAAALTRIRAMPQVPHLMMRINLAPITARLIDAQMRGAAVPAMAEVAQRLGVDADWIVFGHVHRRPAERGGLAAGGGRAASAQHRLLGVRADAARSRRAAPSVLARRRGDRRAGCRAARDRAAR